MNATRTLAALVLAVIGTAGMAGMAHAAGNCTISLKSDDAMKFDQKEVTVSAGCATITVELVHTGKLPVAAMGHNVVISRTADMAGVARDGTKAGAANAYVPAGDARVIAHTDLVGGGARTTLAFPGRKLTAGGDYSFFCSFPGHSALMKGKLVVTP